jgi:hypothetical protein
MPKRRYRSTVGEYKVAPCIDKLWEGVILTRTNIEDMCRKYGYTDVCYAFRADFLPKRILQALYPSSPHYLSRRNNRVKTIVF